MKSFIWIYVSRNGILLPKLFWPTARKNCSSDRNRWFRNLQKKLENKFKAKFLQVKFIYSEKATKFCKISTVDLSYVVKSTVEILQSFVAFSEYMNFKYIKKFCCCCFSENKIRFLNPIPTGHGRNQPIYECHAVGLVSRDNSR